MSWVAIGIAAAGALAGLAQTQHVAHQQDRALAAQITAKGALQKTADAKIAQAVQAMAGSNDAAARQQSQQAYLDTLQLANPGSGINQGPGAFSAQYRQDAANDDAALRQYGADRAALMARLDAPKLQRMNEGILFDNTRNDLRLIGRDASGQAYLDQLKYNSIQKDPWVTAGIQLAQAYGTSKAMGGGATSDPYVIQREPIALQY